MFKYSIESIVQNDQSEVYTPAVLSNAFLAVDDRFLEEILLNARQIVEKVFVPVNGSHIEFQASLRLSIRFIVSRVATIGHSIPLCA